jgi:23S rRNA pseudouridine2605 synthase
MRRYRVRVHGAPTAETVEPLLKGVTVDGERFRPMTVTIDSVKGANAWLTVGVREGRNREVRRALEAVGLTVNRLIRVSYGPFQLGDLAEGAVEEVRSRVLADQLGPARPGAATPAAAGKPSPGKPAPGGARPAPRGRAPKRPA